MHDQLDLLPDPRPTAEALTPTTWHLHGFALPQATGIWAAVRAVWAAAPDRVMVTPGGQPMSVTLSNCGALGWVSDRRGYRYDPCDPQTGRPWPAIPDALLALAVAAAERAGFAGFAPDACLINRYAPGARMGAHQDRNEHDLTAPIVSVSLGLPATFFFGGLSRGGATRKVPVVHGDVLVWGGPDRLRFHGVLPVKPGQHGLTGDCRVNLTFRVAE